MLGVLDSGPPLFAFYPDTNDLTAILKAGSAAAERVREQIEAGVILLLISPVQLWEISAGSRAKAEEDFGRLRELRGTATGLPSPSAIATAVFRQAAGLTDPGITLTRGAPADVMDAVWQWGENDFQAWDIFSTSEGFMRVAARLVGEPDLSVRQTFRETVTSIVGAAKAHPAEAWDQWEAAAVGAYNGIDGIPASRDGTRERGIRFTERTIETLRRSRVARVLYSAHNHAIGTILRPLTMSYSQLDVYSLAPLGAGKAAWDAKRPLGRVVNDAMNVGSPLAVFVAVREERERNQDRRVKHSDFGDLRHLLYTSFADAFTCDKTHRGALENLAVKDCSPWVADAARRAYRCGGGGLAAVAQLAEAFARGVRVPDDPDPSP